MRLENYFENTQERGNAVSFALCDQMLIETLPWILQYELCNNTMEISF